MRFILVLVLSSLAAVAQGAGLGGWRLGVLYRSGDSSGEQVARYYARVRGIPAENLVAVDLPDVDVIDPALFEARRSGALAALPAHVESLALVWSRPFAVGCMSITTAFAAGYRNGFCVPGCAATLDSPLYDTDGWLPADTVGWWPAMLLPSRDVAQARALIDRGRAADHTQPAGTLYLISTDDATRNVRAATYPAVQAAVAGRLRVTMARAPVVESPEGVIGYFTGAAQVPELPRIHFRPGALADHLTSTGGVLAGGSQMSALAWLTQGATAAYGNVSEPCNLLAKFPDIGVLMRRYLQGDTALEAYWKSVRMPGQGLIIGEPLAQPYAPSSR